MGDGGLITAELGGAVAQDELNAEFLLYGFEWFLKKFAEVAGFIEVFEMDSCCAHGGASFVGVLDASVLVIGCGVGFKRIMEGGQWHILDGLRAQFWVNTGGSGRVCLQDYRRAVAIFCRV